MKEIELFPHNEEGYKKLIECLKYNQMVAINHATGTGKSFIILKYLANNKDKKILYMAPTYPIIDQLLEDHTKELGIDIKEFKKLDSCIYSNLLDMDMEEVASNYDIIILDEYHRCGAPKWGEKVNELLEILKQKYPDKKVIGTTATEIRFLDNEKNMNNILFDGVCASKLSLPDAILKGILPVPVYINAVYELYEELDKIENRVRKKCFYEENTNKYLEIVLQLRNQLDKVMSQVGNIKKYLEKEGKYLVFSSKINDIYKDQEIIRKLFKNNVSNNFVVHSQKTRAKNKEEIDNFKNSEKGNNFLYSINILNEGLHVKGVDAIFMLRKTKSPIIYFQQLGRLLSYTKKKKDVFVFDLANNIQNHPHIYMLYQEVFIRAQELIKEEPDKKELYEEILNRFKVVNFTSDICKKTDDLKEQVKMENLRKERLNTAILILQGKIHSTEVEKLQAQIDIFKLKKYIDLEKFRQIKLLDIRKPNIFDLSEIEFEKYLKDEKLKNDYDENHPDESLMRVSNHIVFTKQFEDILKKVDLELKKCKNKNMYIKTLYKELLSFVKDNNRNPRSNEYNTRETELFFKKIIFYEELEKLGCIEFLNNLELQLSKKNIFSKIIDFVSSHNGELPSSKIKDNQELDLARKLTTLETIANENELEYINKLKENYLNRVRNVVKNYVEFIKVNKRYPLKDSKNDFERELFNSYIRCEEMFTVEEKELIKNIFMNVSKKELLKNSYIEMLKNRR